MVARSSNKLAGEIGTNALYGALDDEGIVDTNASVDSSYMTSFWCFYWLWAGFFYLRPRRAMRNIEIESYRKQALQ